MQQAENGISWVSFTLFLITLGILAVCALMMRPFVPALTGAVVLAVITRRPYNWIASKVNNSTLAAATSLILVTLSIIGPAFFLAWNIGVHVVRIARLVQDGTAERGFEKLMYGPSKISAVLQYLVQYLVNNFDLSQTVGKGAGFIASRMTVVLNGSVSALTQVIVMLFILFFLYRDRRLALASLRSLLPLTDSETDLLFLRVHDTIRATIVGRFSVAAVQGLVAGITFAGLGVSGASLLGIVTAFCAIIPSFGAFIVWAPVAVFLAVGHHWIRAIILTGIGSLIISTLDNFLYPILVGTRLQMHTVPIFLSIVGGVWFFGVPGLVLGPIAFALAESLLLTWKGRVTTERTDKTPGLS